eukprot:augustus_masked-scaffold_18-processed-gene-4.38-mRNA-1 protein AED:0.17 eAED:1.00 QI:0/-1/0/1/-1/1/1/0/353
MIFAKSLETHRDIMKEFHKGEVANNVLHNYEGLLTRRRASCPLSFVKYMAKKTKTGNQQNLLTSGKLPFEIDQTQPLEVISDYNTTLVYCLKDKVQNPRCIFKPVRNENVEEKYALNELRFSSKQDALNEICAYEFDKEVFGLVPETVLIEYQAVGTDFEGLLQGSAQEFIENGESAADYGCGLFTQSDIHSIGILDCRILNLDRHAGNMLFVNRKNLVPIDHAFSFPDLEQISQGEIKFDWVLYEQAKKPFSHEMIQKLKFVRTNWRKDVRVAEALGFSQERISILICANVFLSVAALDFNKTLYEIGSLIERSGLRTEPSLFETLLSSVDLTLSPEEIKDAFEKVVSINLN